MTDTSDPGGTAPVVVLSQPREPGKFSGTDDTDAEDWLKLYERVSAHNRWDPTIMLANVSYYLKGAALTWYETEEAKISSWDYFKVRLCELFGNPFGLQLAAKKKLATRAQTSTKPYVAYMHDVLALCHRADDNMSEEEKVGHVLKGIADDAFNLLVCKGCTMVDAIIKECQRFEQVKSRRITPQFTRLPNTAATSTCEAACLSTRTPPTTFNMDTEPAADTVTRIVRREIEAMTPAAVPPRLTDNNLPAISLIQAVVREEFENMGFHPVCSVSHQPVRQAPARAAFCGDYGRSRYRDPAEWRTPDDRPICFNCRRVGHVARYCQHRWFQFPRDTFSRDRFDTMPCPAALHPETSSNQLTPPSLRRPDSTAHPRRTNDSLVCRSVRVHHLRPPSNASRRKTNECSSQR